MSARRRILVEIDDGRLIEIHVSSVLGRLDCGWRAVEYTSEHPPTGKIVGKISKLEGEDDYPIWLWDGRVVEHCGVCWDDLPQRFEPGMYYVVHRDKVPGWGGTDLVAVYKTRAGAEAFVASWLPHLASGRTLVVQWAYPETAMDRYGTPRCVLCETVERSGRKYLEYVGDKAPIA